MTRAVRVWVGTGDDADRQACVTDAGRCWPGVAFTPEKAAFWLLTAAAGRRQAGIGP